METSFDTTFIMLFLVLLIPLTGLLLALTPYLMKKGEVFAVTVPSAAEGDSYLRGLKRRYVLIMIAVTLVLTICALILFAAGSEMGVLVCVIFSAFAIFSLGYTIMLSFRKKVRTYKEQMGWKAVAQESVAFFSEGDTPQAIPLSWNLMYLPIFVATAVIGYLGYDLMPNQIPMQVGLGGEVTNWMEKSPLAIWLPVIIEVFFALCFVLAHWAIVRSKRPAEPNAPASSALAYGMFAHAQSLYLLVGGLAMTASIIAMPLTMMGVITFAAAIMFIIIFAFLLIIGAFVVSIVYGQGGSRVFARMQESEDLLVDDDRYWKLGIFYYNTDDPNLFLPARFGIGWTCNFARPLVWVLTAGIVVLTIVFVVVVMAIA